MTEALASPAIPAPAPLGACERCGDYAALSTLTGTALCGGCLERSPIGLAGQVPLGRVMRDTVQLTKQLWTALPALVGWSASSLGARVLASRLLEPESLGLKALDAGIDLFAEFAMAAFLAACAVGAIHGGAPVLGRAARRTMQAAPALLGLTLVAVVPTLVAHVAGDSPRSSGPTGRLLTGLVLMMSLFVPTLLVMRPPALLGALRDSPAILRSRFFATLGGLAAFNLPALLGEVIARGLVLWRLANLFKDGPSPADTLKLVTAWSEWGGHALAMPLFAFGCVFRALLTLQARARGVVS
jgi:hypothetical protein